MQSPGYLAGLGQMARFGAILRGKYPIPERFHSTLQDDIEKAGQLWLMAGRRTKSGRLLGRAYNAPALRTATSK